MVSNEEIRQGIQEKNQGISKNGIILSAIYIGIFNLCSL